MKQHERMYSPSEIGELGWALAEGQTDEYPFQVRFRFFPADFPKSHYPIRLNVFWGMEHPREDGLASMNDITAMQAFEDRIVQVSERDGRSVLAAVLTGRGEREFIFHVKSADEFVNCLHGIPQEATRYPIEIFSSDDPDWEYFQNVVGGIS